MVTPQWKKLHLFYGLKSKLGVMTWKNWIVCLYLLGDCSFSENDVRVMDFYHLVPCLAFSWIVCLNILANVPKTARGVNDETSWRRYDVISPLMLTGTLLHLHPLTVWHPNSSLAKLLSQTKSSFSKMAKLSWRPKTKKAKGISDLILSFCVIG